MLYQDHLDRLLNLLGHRLAVCIESAPGRRGRLVEMDDEADYGIVEFTAWDGSTSDERHPLGEIQAVR